MLKSPRDAVVICDGAKSESFIISNIVFQGTVLGPPLWNSYFGTVQDAISADGVIPSVFADDSNSCKGYPGRN